MGAQVIDLQTRLLHKIFTSHIIISSNQQSGHQHYSLLPRRIDATQPTQSVFIFGDQHCGRMANGQQQQHNVIVAAQRDHRAADEPAR